MFELTGLWHVEGLFTESWTDEGLLWRSVRLRCLLLSTKEDHYLIHHEEDAHKRRSLLGS